jgi:hypothetical protein
MNLGVRKLLYFEIEIPSSTKCGFRQRFALRNGIQLNKNGEKDFARRVALKLSQRKAHRAVRSNAVWFQGMGDRLQSRVITAGLDTLLPFGADRLCKN